MTEIKDGSTYRICPDCGDEVPGMMMCYTCRCVAAELQRRKHNRSIFGTVPLHDDFAKIKALADLKEKETK